jgi:hypothetical protein
MDIAPPLKVEDVKTTPSNSRAGSHPWGAVTPEETRPEQAVPDSEKKNPLFDFFKKLSKPYQK